MRVTYTHHSTPDVVRDKLEDAVRKALDMGQGRVDSASYEWHGNVMNFAVTAMKTTISGIVEVTDTEVILDAKVPLMLRPFEGRAKSRILETFRETFE